MTRRTPVTLVAALALLTAGRAAAGPPEDALLLPLDAHGFVAGQALQAQYTRKLQRDALARAAAAKPAPARAAEEAPPRSPTAVVVAFAPAGNTPTTGGSGTATTREPAASAKPRTATVVASAPPGNTPTTGGATTAAPAAPSLGARLSAFFSRSKAPAVPPSSRDLPYLGR